MAKIFAVLVLMIIGGGIIGASTYVIPGGLGYIYKQNQDLIRQCEKELPRNQKCKLIAVPEIKDE